MDLSIYMYSCVFLYLLDDLSDNENADYEADDPTDKDYHPDQESDYSNGEEIYGNDNHKISENDSYENQQDSITEIGFGNSFSNRECECIT